MILWSEDFLSWRFLQIFLVSAVTIFLYACGGFFLSLQKQRSDIADILWGPGFVVVALTAALMNPFLTHTQFIATVLVFIWALRLGISIFARNSKKLQEDFRYRDMKNSWGNSKKWQPFTHIFLLQGLLLLIVALPLLLMNVIPQRLIVFGFVEVLGLILWLIGFVFESVADYQLFVFKNKPENKGKIITTGLWKYSRHPNYFGEVLLWWGLFVFLIKSIGIFPGILGPILLTFLILKVSGVPLLEKRYQDNKDFADYAKKTNVFFPWLQKK